MRCTKTVIFPGVLALAVLALSDTPLTAQLQSASRPPESINWPKLAGIASSTALTTLYYPTVGFCNESNAFATSLATSVMNDELHEFGGGLLHLLHRKKNPK